MITRFDIKMISDAFQRQRTRLPNSSLDALSFDPELVQSVDSGYIWLPFEVVSYAEKDPLLDTPLTVGQFLSFLKSGLLTKDQVTFDNMYIEGNQSNDFLWSLDNKDDLFYPLYIPWRVDDVSRYPGIYSVLGISDSNDSFLYWQITKNLVIRWAGWPREAPERVKLFS